jgi:hypothetical protein
VLPTGDDPDAGGVPAPRSHTTRPAGGRHPAVLRGVRGALYPVQCPPATLLFPGLRPHLVRPARSGTVTLVPCDPATCPTCQAALRHGHWEQPALLRHGGHGATQRTTVRWCANCTWVLISEIREARP